MRHGNLSGLKYLQEYKNYLEYLRNCARSLTITIFISLNTINNITMKLSGGLFELELTECGHNTAPTGTDRFRPDQGPHNTTTLSLSLSSNVLFMVELYAATNANGLLCSLLGLGN